MSLIEFFNDPKSAVIFYAGIGISILFLVAVTKLIYGPKGVPKKKDRITLRKYKSYIWSYHFILECL